MARAPGDASSLRNKAWRNRAWRSRAGRFAAAFAALGFAALAASFARDVDSRAHLIAPPPTPILYDRHGAFIAQIGNARAGGGEERRLDLWLLAD